MSTIKKAFTIAAGCVAAVVFTASAQQDKPAPQPPQQKDNKVYVSVDTQPSFNGGLPAFSNYLTTSIRYPAVDRQNKVEGKVFVTFIIEPDGSVTNVLAARGPSETLKAEALRVMQASPKWTPGMQGGKPVRAQYTVPINFTLDNKAKQ